MEGFKPSDIKDAGTIFFKSGITATEGQCMEALTDQSLLIGLKRYIRIKKYGWPHPWSDSPAALVEFVELIDRIREIYEQSKD